MRNTIGRAIATLVLKIFCTRDYQEYTKLVVSYGEAEIEERLKRTK